VSDDADDLGKLVAQRALQRVGFLMRRVKRQIRIGPAMKIPELIAGRVAPAPVVEVLRARIEADTARGLRRAPRSQPMSGFIVLFARPARKT
jgi:hypothetical protein